MRKRHPRNARQLYEALRRNLEQIFDDRLLSFFLFCLFLLFVLGGIILYLSGHYPSGEYKLGVFLLGGSAVVSYFQKV